MEKYNFIVLAPNRWEGVWMNRQHLFSIIGEEHNVIYSNAPFKHWDRKLSRYKAAPFFGTNTKVNNVYNIEFPKYMLRITKLKSWDNLVKKNFVKQIQRRIDSDYRTILYVFNPIYGEYIDEIPHDFLVYHPYDDFNSLYSDDVAKNGEELLLKKADVMFTTSKLLQKNYIERFHQPEKVYFVPNGVDFTLFSNVNNKVIGINSEINRPKVGYTGSINAKIDISLLLQLFQSLSHCDFYVVGSEGTIDSFQNEDMGKLKALSNVYFLGNQKLADVPSYMNAMDVNIIPYRTDPDSFANAGYPLKLHEYLTVGKPIICSPIDSAFEFENVIAIRDGVDEWANEINKLLSYKDTVANIEHRQSVAKNNTWKKRTESILHIISKIF